MSKTRKAVVAVVTMLSLAGVGAVAGAGPSQADSSSPEAIRWCC